MEKAIKTTRPFSDTPAPTGVGDGRSVGTGNSWVPAMQRPPKRYPKS